MLALLLVVLLLLALFGALSLHNLFWIAVIVLVAALAFNLFDRRL